MENEGTWSFQEIHHRTRNAIFIHFPEASEQTLEGMVIVQGNMIISEDSRSGFGVCTPLMDKPKYFQISRLDLLTGDTEHHRLMVCWDDISMNWVMYASPSLQVLHVILSDFWVSLIFGHSHMGGQAGKGGARVQQLGTTFLLRFGTALWCYWMTKERPIAKVL